MTAPRFRARTFRRIYKKLPGGVTKLRYERRKPRKARCSDCGKSLHGIKGDISVRIRRLAKSEKRPERMYGGNLCSKCSREKIKERIRG